MELPVIQRGSPSASALVRAVKRGQVILARTVATETELDIATIFVNPERPRIWIANSAHDLAPREGCSAQDVIDQVFEPFEGAHISCHVLHAAEPQWSAEVGSVLADRGYGPKKYQVLLLHRYVPPMHREADLQVIPIRAAYAEARRIYHDQAMIEQRGDSSLARDLTETRIDMLDEPRLEVFLGRWHGRPVGVAGVLTLGDIGVIHPTFIHSDFRDKGMGSALTAHVLEHCQRAVIQSVVLQRPDGCGSIPFYESLGFGVIASFDSYWRSADPNHADEMPGTEP